MVPAAAAAELYLVNRVILVDHTRWEGGLANRTRMRGILSELAHLGKFASLPRLHVKVSRFDRIRHGHSGSG